MVEIGQFSKRMEKKEFLIKGDGGVGTFHVGGGACLHLWFKSYNFLGARLIRVRNSYNKFKLNFNDL